MEYSPFTLEEANEIAEDFEDLIDTEFSLNNDVFLIDSVTVCPFNEDDKEIFTEAFHQTKDYPQSIAFYSGNEFDVIILASHAADEANYTWISIRNFAAEKGIKYNFPSSLI